MRFETMPSFYMCVVLSVLCVEEAGTGGKWSASRSSELNSVMIHPSVPPKGYTRSSDAERSAGATFRWLQRINDDKTRTLSLRTHTKSHSVQVLTSSLTQRPRVTSSYDRRLMTQKANSPELVHSSRWRYRFQSILFTPGGNYNSDSTGDGRRRNAKTRSFSEEIGRFLHPYWPETSPTSSTIDTRRTKFVPCVTTASTPLRTRSPYVVNGTMSEQCNLICPTIYVRYGMICGIQLGYDKNWTYKFESFPNMCELEYANCKDKLNKLMWVAAYRGPCIRPFPTNPTDNLAIVNRLSLYRGMTISMILQNRIYIATYLNTNRTTNGPTFRTLYMMNTTMTKIVPTALDEFDCFLQKNKYCNK